MAASASIRSLVQWAMVVPLAVAGTLIALATRLRGTSADRPRLVWGSTPLINNRHWSRAMRAAGYLSDTYTQSFYASINSREDWDLLLDERWGNWPPVLRPTLGFLEALARYDVVFLSADGLFIGRTPGMWRLQAPLLKLAGRRIVFIPYGGDTYVYRRVRSTALQHALQASYPLAARDQDALARRLDYWCRHAHACLPAVMGMDGFGRWDVLMPSVLFLDLEEWRPSTRNSEADGRKEAVRICHTPNHRGFKGTEFLLDAVDRLRGEGLLVELVLLEKIQNDEVRRILRDEADILVEQLIFTGHGLSGLEGMASGLPVVSNLEDDDYLLPMRRWSYLSECPIASASPETLIEVLRQLVTRPDLRAALGAAGRAYTEKYHGQDSAVHLFEAVLDLVHGRRDSLLQLFHPLLGEYTRRKPPVRHPLVDHRIVD